MLVILIFLISILCLTSVSASDIETMDTQSIYEIDDSNFISSTNSNDDVEKEIANEVFIGNDEDDSSEDISLEEEKSLSTSKKTKVSDSSSTDLELDNDADKENIHVGDLVTWILEVKNNGPNVAKNVKLLDQLPEGLKFVRYSASKGVFNITTGIWEIGDLQVGEKQVLKIVTKALTLGEKTNKANLTSDTEITVPDKCYEEEEIDVVKKTYNVKAESKKFSKTLYPTGNPIAVLLVSVLVLLGASIKRRY